MNAFRAVMSFGNSSVKKLPLIIQKSAMRKIAVLIFLFSSFLHAQNDSTFVDDKYLEDQLYFNLTYIHLLNLPDRISQSGFSFGLGVGFIKDFPLNEKRNIGLGAGLGYGFNNYFFNVKIDEEIPIEGVKIDLNNKIILHTVELPIELRFRGSTATKYKFWRFYPGFKIAYAFGRRTSFGKSEDLNVKDIIEVNELLYGLTFSAGYNKWNFYLYYGLNDLFNTTPVNDFDINISDLRAGLIFYIF
ncbi:MAG: PorT family protein [Flavobacteriales bacterium]|nr:PorT family protein [Flavobacteriales bacterium]